MKYFNLAFQSYSFLYNSILQCDHGGGNASVAWTWVIKEVRRQRIGQILRKKGETSRTLNIQGWRGNQRSRDPNFTHWDGVLGGRELIRNEEESTVVEGRSMTWRGAHMLCGGGEVMQEGWEDDSTDSETLKPSARGMAGWADALRGGHHANGWKKKSKGPRFGFTGWKLLWVDLVIAQLNEKKKEQRGK